MLSAMNAFLMNAIFYLLRTGCPGRYLPTGSFRRARRSTTFREGVSEATWEELRAALRERGSEPQRRRCRRPIAQVGGKGGSAKGEADAVGYDAGKKVKGRKIHALVDAGGLRLRIVVHSAPIQDRRPGLDRIRQCFNWRTLGRWRLRRPPGRTRRRVQPPLHVEIVNARRQFRIYLPAVSVGCRTDLFVVRPNTDVWPGTTRTSLTPSWLSSRWPASRQADHSAYILAAKNEFLWGEVDEVATALHSPRRFAAPPFAAAS